MSKTTPAAPAVTTNVPAEQKPQTLELVGPIPSVLAQLCAHVRSGFTLDMDAYMHLFGGNGNIALILKQGDPDLQFVQAAKLAAQEALERQQAQHERDIEERAAQLVADRERAAARAAMEVQIAEHEATLKAMRAAAAAV
jgi:hypothetical protein